MIAFRTNNPEKYMNTENLFTLLFCVKKESSAWFYFQGQANDPEL